MSPVRALLCLALSFGAMGCGSSRVEVFDKPDVILVVIDTWRWDSLGANGSPRANITPNLDHLAADGVRFSRNFTSSPWTGSSVGTMVTGQLPTVHGVYGRFVKVGSLRPSVPTLAELLSAAGYRTVAVANGFFVSPDFGFDRGYELYDFDASSNRKIRRAGPSVDAALRHAREARNEGPLLLMLHVFDPHLAYDPPKQWQRKYTPDYHGMFADLGSMRSGSFAPSAEELAYIRGLYDAEVSYVDQQLGRFFAELDRVLRGRERMILVTADHGEEFGEHGGWEHGQSMYRELVQVPLIIVPPASRPPARGVVDAQVRMQDVLPTLLEAAGVAPPKNLPGTSLFPWFEGSLLDDDLVAYSEREHLGPRSVAIRDGKHALVLYPDEERMELYDQLADPAETKDLAAVLPERVRVLRERLDATAALFEEVAGNLEAHQGVELSPEQLEQMRALGYTDAPPPPEEDEDE